ncbi:FxSxx-COOH protein [Streptomyces sp. NBC_00820]|uniref:FxSxx-COOH cyclophane-containing RiPP peptide n=1 Tax=Streptomyces sp. NBC_00820 TaxID=2975842 RepID=UPI002ED43DFF|nr:FxSxx-COOH protein [Streptomyces sp. NBC_00820]
MSQRDESSTREYTGPLPDLLALDLEELRTVEHPVLQEVLAGLRERAERPSEMLWGFNSSL